MMTESGYRAAVKLWDYMKQGDSASSADGLLVLGSIDDSVAVRAATLSNQFSYSWVMFTGEVAHGNDLLVTSWNGTEAEHFNRIFMKSGGRAKSIFLENEATNTGQNATLSYQLLKSRGMTIPETLQVVTKPYMLRRERATFEMQWPWVLKDLYVTCPQMSFDYYANKYQAFGSFVDVMVGDFETIILYADKGFSTCQNIPEDVLSAWKELVVASMTNI